MPSICPKSLRIGEVLHDKLSTILNTFPIIAEEGKDGVRFPFAVYRRTSLYVSNTKDRYDDDETANFDLSIVTNNYPEGIELAEKVCDALVHWRIQLDDNAEIYDVEVSGGQEEYVNGAFIQRLFLTFSITK